MDGVVGQGVYSLHEAARLAAIPIVSVRRWISGYEYRRGESVHQAPPVILADFDPLRDIVVASFADLMELRCIAEFRKRGVSLQALRLAAIRGRELFNTRHPFATARFLTDGRSVMAEIAEAEGEPVLLDVVKNQTAFKRVLAPYLQGLVLGEDGMIRRWRPAGRRFVVLDPQRSFGAPIVTPHGVPTATIAAAVQAEESPQRVAEIFQLPIAAVRDAVLFEKSLAA